jgi:uncharacterized protein YgfB (UPF0149 family)
MFGTNDRALKPTVHLITSLLAGVPGSTFSLQNQRRKIMSTTHLPDFEHTLALTQGKLEASELAECHGVACGLLCRLPAATVDAYIDLLDMLELVKTPDEGLQMAFEELLNASKAQLSDEDMSITLWLPNDDEMLEERTMALSQWCSGFLAGVGSSGDETLQALSDEANDALKDIQQISTADVSDTNESEEDEMAFVEIVEYIRIVTLMIREDLRGPEQQDLIH